MNIEEGSKALNEALRKLVELDSLIANYQKTADTYLANVAEETAKKDPLLAEVKAAMKALDDAIKAAGK